MKSFPVVLILIICLASSCSSCEVKEKANKAGKEAGQVIGEFATGISSGVETSVEVTPILSEELKNKGIRLGKTIVSSANEGKDNVLSVYIILDKEFRGTLTAKAYDRDSLEMGRAKVTLTDKKDDAHFIDFQFDKRTNIDNDSKLVIE